MSGYIKLYRVSLDHEILSKDNSAYIVFTKLLMKVDRDSGKYTTGRFKLGELVNLPPMTAWDALKRLEKHGMVSILSHNRFSTIYICNWKKYQESRQKSVTSTVTSVTEGDNTDTVTSTVNIPSSNRHQTVTKQEERIKNKNKTLVETPEQVREIYDHYLQVFDKNETTYKLTDKRKLKIKARLRDSSKQMILEAIDRVGASEWHRGDNDRGWKADLDFIIRTYEQVEKLSQMAPKTKLRFA